MDAEVKKHLDLRLAKGEITQDEYHSLHRTLRGENLRTENGVTDRSLAFLRHCKERYWGAGEMIVPTDEHPLDVDGDLFLFGQHLAHKGLKFRYSEIESVSYKAVSQSVNLIPTSKSTSFSIQFKGGHSISCGSSTVFVRGGKSKRIENAYAFLRQITFRERMVACIHLLESQGFIEVGKVRIYPNGDVEKGDTRINLRQSRLNKSFFIGTKGAYGSRNPDEVLVGQKGTSIFATRIRFQLRKDKDVLKALLEWLASSD